MKANLSKKIEDVMQKNIVTVKFNAPVASVAKLLKERKISGVVVVDNVGEALGIISSLDLFKTLRSSADGLTAEEVMTPFTIDISPESTLEEAALATLDNHIHRLVVIEAPHRRKPVGIITSTDIINNLYSH